MVKTYTLPNGIHIVTYNIPQVKSLHVSVAIKCGSLVEEKSVNGVAHFMEHMLVQGIPSFPNVEKLSTHVEGLAGAYNAYTSQLLVSFGITLPFIHIKEAIKIASEVIFSPLFPEDVLEKERKAVISEITQRKDSLGYKLGKEFKTVRFSPQSILHQEVGGELEAVKRLTRQDLMTYWEKYFLSSNTYIYIGGNFDEKELAELLEHHFSSQQKKGEFTGYPQLSEKDFSQRSVIIKENKELGVNYLTFSFPSMSLQEPWKITAMQDIALTVLGQLRTSRLFKLLRYQKGLVYGVSSQRALLPSIGYIDIGSETASEHLEEVIGLITTTVADYIANGPTEEEMAFVKNYFTSSWLMAFDNPSSVADWLEEELLWEEKVRMPEEYIDMIKSITKEDIIDVMKKYWNLSKLQLLIQGPTEDTKENKETFSKILEIL